VLLPDDSCFAAAAATAKDMYTQQEHAGAAGGDGSPLLGQQQVVEVATVEQDTAIVPNSACNDSISSIAARAEPASLAVSALGYVQRAGGASFLAQLLIQAGVPLLLAVSREQQQCLATWTPGTQQVRHSNILSVCLAAAEIICWYW
jgi:hypothetical protein